MLCFPEEDLLGRVVQGGATALLFSFGDFLFLLLVNSILLRTYLFV